MNIGDFNFLEKKLDQENTKSIANDLITNFIKELGKAIENFTKNNMKNSNNLNEESIYVVRDINDEKISLINIDSGKEFDIYTVSSEKDIEKLNNNGIFDNIYQMSKDDLYSLNLGAGITVKDDKCIPYNGEIKIENKDVAAKLEDMYFCIEQEKEATYSVLEISDKKIFLTDIKEGGYFSIPKDMYPNFKAGDLVKNKNGKYVLL